MSDPKPPLAEIEVKAPNLHLRFKASQERIARVLETVLKEALEAEEEYRIAAESKVK